MQSLAEGTLQGKGREENCLEKGDARYLPIFCTPSQAVSLATSAFTEASPRATAKVARTAYAPTTAPIGVNVASTAFYALPREQQQTIDFQAPIIAPCATELLPIAHSLVTTVVEGILGPVDQGNRSYGTAPSHISSQHPLNR